MKIIIVVGASANPLVDHGLLRVVNRISTAGGTVTLTTSQAGLQQEFRSTDFTATGNEQSSGAQDYQITMLNPARADKSSAQVTALIAGLRLACSKPSMSSPAQGIEAS